MTLPAFRSKGAYGTGTTSCIAAVPTGGNAPQQNDILLIVVESADSNTAAGTPNTPANWTKIFEETQGNGAAGVTTLTIFGKRAGASESDVTIDGVGNHCSATMLVYQGCITTEDAWVVGTGNGANSGNGTVSGLNTPVADCLVLAFCCTTRDQISSALFSAWTNANLSNLTEREDNCTNTGNGGGFGVADGGKASAGATGDTTVTIAVSLQWRSVHVALKPVPAGTQTSDNQPAYLKGEATASDNQSAYLRGEATASDNQPAYLAGRATGSDNQPAYLRGTDTASDNQPAYLSGGISASDNQIAYLYGEAQATDNQPAYLRGAAQASDAQPAYLNGSATAADSQAAFLLGRDTAADSQPAYLRGSATAGDSQPAYLSGASGGTEASDNQTIYLRGTAVAVDSQSVYLFGELPPLGRSKEPSRIGKRRQKREEEIIIIES